MNRFDNDAIPDRQWSSEPFLCLHRMAFLQGPNGEVCQTSLLLLPCLPPLADDPVHAAQGEWRLDLVLEIFCVSRG